MNHVDDKVAFVHVECAFMVHAFHIFRAWRVQCYILFMHITQESAHNACLMQN